MARHVIKILCGQLCGRESKGTVVAGYRSPSPDLGKVRDAFSENVAVKTTS